MTRPPPLLVIALIAVMTLIEGALLLSDIGVLPGGLRAATFEAGAFWPGLLGDWQPIFPGQPATMFVTHSFLHGGLLHLLMNAFALSSLGTLVARLAGPGDLALIYIAAMLGGGAGFAVLSGGSNPMVGASGAIFGLAGALVAWQAQDARSLGLPLAPVARTLALLVALNVVLWALLAGRLAWQAHLGGAIAGALVALPVDREGRRFLPRRR